MQKSRFIFAALLTFSLNHTANANEFEAIALATDAKEFARIDNTLPAVLSYFSAQSEEALQQLYISTLGEPLFQERKKGFLTLVFKTESKNIRLIISSRNNNRQVDIMVHN